MTFDLSPRGALKQFLGYYCVLRPSNAYSHCYVSLCTFIWRVFLGIAFLGVVAAGLLFATLGVAFAIYMFAVTDVGPVQLLSNSLMIRETEYMQLSGWIQASGWSLLIWHICIVVGFTLAFVDHVLPLVGVGIAAIFAGLGWVIVWCFRSTGAVKITDVVNAVRGKACIKIDLSKLFRE